MAENGDGKFPAERFVGFAKDIIVLLRDTALLVLAVLLLLFPKSFNDLLVSAGFEEGSIVGFKWKAKLVEADDALNEAKTTIAVLKDQLDKATKALAEAQASIGDQTLKSAISKLNEESDQITMASGKVEASVSSIIASQASLVERAQSTVNTSGGWGVVFGSDVSLDAAKDEIVRATKKGIPTAGIYFRNGYYASIVVVDNRTTAHEYLTIAKTFRPDAYIASMVTWCRKPQQRDGFIEC